MVGVLALQGGFAAHRRMLAGPSREVRTPADLEGCTALVLPGGESTTMRLGIEREGLAEPLRAFAAEHRVLGTCAGMILLDRSHLGIGDWTCGRNAFGRQIRSFEDSLEVDGFGTVSAVFIRAPWVVDAGPGVRVLGSVDGHPVAVRQDNLLALSFHPEMAGEDRFHRWLTEGQTTRP